MAEAPAMAMRARTTTRIRLTEEFMRRSPGFAVFRCNPLTFREPFSNYDVRGVGRTEPDWAVAPFAIRVHLDQPAVSRLVQGPERHCNHIWQGFGFDLDLDT